MIDLLTLQKYDRIRKMRAYAGFVDGEYCPRCLSVSSRDKEKDTCTICEMQLPRIFGFCMGIPIYDPKDAVNLKGEDPFKMYTSGAMTL